MNVPVPLPSNKESNLLLTPQHLRRRAGKFLGPRIAQRIFIGYVLPLSVLLTFGLLLPIFLWSYLGNAISDFSEREIMADRAVAMRRSALDAEAHARGFLQYNDQDFEAKFGESRDDFRSHYRELLSYADRRQNPTLTHSLEVVGERFRIWNRNSISRAIRELRNPNHSPLAGKEAALRASSNFGAVRSALETFVYNTNAYRNQQKPVAQAADLLRRITSVVVPVVAVVLSLLIGRSVALGITRPLETLIRAIEQLEQGKTNKLLLEGETSESALSGADDEIGDLQRAFRRMARTIEQREAVSRAQYEAVGALNRRIEAVLNATNDGILLIDRSGGFAVVSQRLGDLFGLSPEQIQDHTWAQAGPLLLSRFRNRSAVRERFREILDDTAAITEETFDTEGPGALRSLRVYSAPVRGTDAEDELLGRIFVFRDVTRETMVDRMKTEFVSTVSHELRTPLTAIKGYVDLIVSGQTGPLTDVQTEFLTLVQGSTRRLTTLINDMLDISRIESGRMEMKFDSVDYLPIVREAVQMMQQEADARHITLSVEVLGVALPDGSFPFVSGDADRITQIITNFLSNGIKYTPPGGSVSIRIEFEDNFVTTCVADTGIGISPEDQRKLFQKFFRADNSTTREVGGTGLGLAITKAILEKLHGSVWVESERDRGSRFWFTLPTADLPDPPREHLAASGGVSGAYSAPAPHLVLSIDGDISLLHRLGHELRRQGFVTSNAANAADALRRARDLRPDLITVDLLSPTIEGVALLQTLQQNPATHPIPIALLSPATAGGKTELLDTVAYLPHSASDSEWETTLRDALNLPNEGNTPAGGGGGQSLALLIADGELPERLRGLLARLTNGLPLVTARTADEADRITSGERLPDIIIMDTRCLPAPQAGLWVARLQKRHPAMRVPLIVVTEEDVCQGQVYSLVPLGSGPVPLEEMGTAVQALLERLHQDNIALPDPLTAAPEI